MRGPGARPSFRLPGILVNPPVIAIAIPKLHIQIVFASLNPTGPQIRSRSCDVARICLLHREQSHWPALRFICGEYFGPGLPLQDHRQLPGEIMRVLNARVAPETAIWRHDVRRIAGNKDTSVLKTIRHVGLCFPRHDVLDRDGNFVRAQGDANELPATFLGKAGGYVRYRVFRIAQRVDGEKTRIERLLKAEETAQRWIRDVDDAEIPAAQERRDISAEVDCDAVRKSSAAPHGDAQAFAHSAVRAIRR